MPAIYINSTKIAGVPALPVVQTTGSSTTDVMSQNAVTEALGGKQASLPTTSTAGKVLKSTSIAGSVEWGDATGGGSIDNIKAGGKDLTITDKRVEIDKILTKAEYEALSTAEKTNGMCYFVTDEDEPEEIGTAIWGKITGSLSAQTDLQTALNAKQATLTAGTGITISGGTISVSFGNAESEAY